MIVPGFQVVKNGKQTWRPLHNLLFCAVREDDGPIRRRFAD